MNSARALSLRTGEDVQHSGFTTARKLPPVRRCLAILLLALLPAQFSWAMVGQYCNHETGEQSKHFGHHSHQHKQSAAEVQFEASETDAPSQVSFGGMHTDCHSCHLSCGLAVLAPPAHAEPPGVSVRPNGPSRATGTHLADQPERPQWPHSRIPV